MIPHMTDIHGNAKRSTVASHRASPAPCQAGRRGCRLTGGAAQDVDDDETHDDTWHQTISTAGQKNPTLAPSADDVLSTGGC